MKLEFSRQISEEQTPDFIKIRPVGAELFLADGQTGMTKLIAAFRNFVNAPKNLIVCNQLLTLFTAFLLTVCHFYSRFHGIRKHFVVYKNT